MFAGDYDLVLGDFRSAGELPRSQASTPTPPKEAVRKLMQVHWVHPREHAETLGKVSALEKELAELRAATKEQLENQALENMVLQDTVVNYEGQQWSLMQREEAALDEVRRLQGELARVSNTWEAYWTSGMRMYDPPMNMA